MKILMLNYEYPPLGGGGGVISKYLSEQFRLNHQVYVITTWFEGLPEIEEKENLTIRRLKCRRKNLYQSNPIEMLDWIRKTKTYTSSLVKKQKFDICFANFVLPGGAVGSYLKDKFNIPFVVISHGHDIPWVHAKKLWPLYLFAFSRIKTVLKKASAVYVQTDEMESNLKRFSKSGFGKAIKIPNGIPKGLPQKKQSNSFNAILCGRLVHQKNPVGAINAFMDFLGKGGEGQLHVLGDGPLLGILKNMVEKRNCSDKIIFHGKVAHHMVLDRMQSAQVYLSSSQNEGMSIAMLEAAAIGLYIITTSVSGANLVVNENNGRFVAFNNSDGISSALMNAYNKWKNQNILVTSEQVEKIRNKYNWEQIGNEYLKNLSSIIA